MGNITCNKKLRKTLVYNKNYSRDFRNAEEHTSPQLKKYCKEFNAKMIKTNLSTARDVEKIVTRLTNKLTSAVSNK